MEVIPAIDLIDGMCVRLYQGDYSRKTVYDDDPAGVARRWESLGANRIHVVDLDGAKAGTPQNLDAIQRIVRGGECPGPDGRRPAHTGRCAQGDGPRRSARDARHRGCPGPGYRSRSLRRAGKRLRRGGRGFQRTGKLPCRDGHPILGSGRPTCFSRMAEAGVRTFLCTDISRDGTLQGPDYQLMAELVGVAGDGVIAAGGIASVEHLRRLAEVGVGGAVIGRALYTGDIDLAEALEAIAPC